MSRGLAWSLGLILVGAVAAPANADGPPDCVPCASPQPDHPSRSVLFGDGNGYTAGVVAADVGAMATAGVLLSVSYATHGNTISLDGLGAASVPLVLSGPLIHFIHGRPIFGLVSMLGWASLEATAIGLGAGLGESAMPSSNDVGGQDNRVRGGVVGVSIAVVGGALMTLLDGWMARSVHSKLPASPKAVLTPSVWTTAGGGGGAGVAGTF